VISSPKEMQELETVATEVAAVLRALGNERRLMVVCKLSEWGEANVTTLAEAVGLSQSALSQHLTKLRERGIVDYRRDSQTLWYRISDPRIEKLFATLHGLFCHPQAGGNGAPAARKLRKVKT
jgi:ArsR family transcriptional regulator, virulence genes transcriptional regulator